jgi:deoxyribodipyrimidine photo-lyase
LNYDRALVWFRRDLRLEDHAALHYALTSARAVFCAFCFDTEILDALPSRQDRRVEFIWESIAELHCALQAAGGGLYVLHGRARRMIPQLSRELAVDAVFCNRDYEPQARTRDAAVETALRTAGIAFCQYKDQVIFDEDEVLTQSQAPFSVFTPYKNAWLKRLTPSDLGDHPVQGYLGHLAPGPRAPLPTLEALGFERTNLKALPIPTGMSGARTLFEKFIGRIDHYKERRDYPALPGPSYLSVHLRFGTISIRELARAAHARRGEGAQVWLSELIWRDFYFMILHHHPHVATSAFKRQYDEIKWDNDPEWFAAWCEARTGYPLVDAAMRQINQTGYMHNRLRMVSASFLTKDLGIDWRLGERYFADHLNDFDLAANNGGWQWAASTGCDAQPYFRIFNPVTQSERFDPQGAFIRRYVPELANCRDEEIHAPWRMSRKRQEQTNVIVGESYPAPIVDHAVARFRTLRRYAIHDASAKHRD